MNDDYLTNDLSGFGGDPSRVGVGYKGFQYDDGDVNIGAGDVVYWEDPDAGHHAGECPCISERDYVTVVDCVFAVDYDWVEGYAVEIGVKAPLGRLGYPDVVFSDTDVTEHIERKFSAFHDSEYGRYMKWEGHFDLRDVPEQYVDGHENARPSCWYADDDGHTTHTTGE